MMGALREWLSSIVMVSVLLSAAQVLVPEGNIRKTVSFTGGLILLVTLIQPILGADLERLNLGLDTYRVEIETRQSALEQESEAELKKLIEQQTGAYIMDKAGELDVRVQVRVYAETGPEGVPVPNSAELWGTRSETLVAYLERELGIPSERQVWHEN